MKTRNLSSDDLEEMTEYLQTNTKTKFMNNEKEISAKIFKSEISVSKFKNKTVNQSKIVKSIIDKGNTITIVSGKPGTGKTYTAIQGALKEFKNGSYNKLYLTKSVKTLDNKSEDIGFLKGDLEEKIKPFLFSYDFNFKQIIPESVYEKARQS